MSLYTQMSEEEDVPILPPGGKLAELGIAAQDVNQYSPIKAYSDILCYAATDACRKGLVGKNGTNLQMVSVIDDNEHFVLGQVCLFLVKNQIKPLASDLFMLDVLVKETARRLGEGDMHAVNRHYQLTCDGVLKPSGDDIVPDAVRATWVAE